MKRWDAIAYHEFAELHPNFITHFRGEVSGGVGGIITTTTTSAAATSVSKSSKSAQRRTEVAEESQKKFMEDLAIALKPAQDPAAQLRDQLLAVSSTLRELVSANDDDDADLIAHFQKQKSQLRCDE